ncbi:hypothetical protein IE81DRAFT_64021 [Ceraceosorus guamensis]|uniref:Uncharacterized protein n=1 Tax=Ceraceosorus guamensis TaxID=1522189 RepID=A0A316VMV6_9BASI|nr:hypothetical protein IE81DRAFT_64021 [Ceraceosorus guamensis]PWN38912.1 hypothetical protein IE81DRAFT_64021 [Ceraceosorus guamensis]
MSTPPASRERLPTLRSEPSGSGQGTSITGAATGRETSPTRRPTRPQASSTPQPGPVQPNLPGDHRGSQYEQRFAAGSSASGATYSGRSAALRSPSWASDVSPRPDAALQDWSNSELRRPTIARPPPLHVASHSVAERASFPPFYHHARAVRPDEPLSREPVAGPSRWPASGPHRDPRARSPVREVAYSDVRYGSQSSREPFRNAVRSPSQVGLPSERGAASRSSRDGYQPQASRERSSRDYLAPAPPPPPPPQAGESLSRSYDGPTRLLPAHRSMRLSGSPGLERAQGRSYDSFMPPPPSPSSRGSPFRKLYNWSRALCNHQYRCFQLLSTPLLSYS